MDQQNRSNQNQNQNRGQTGGNMGGNQQNQQYVEQIRNELRGVNFPASRDELIQKKGDQRLDLGGRNMTFRDLLQNVRQDRFQSEQELINNINQSGNIGGQRS